MSDISDLESRISAAMDRIGRGLEGLAKPAAGDIASDQSEALQAELDAEKTANAQLEERNKTLNGRIDAAETALADANDAIDKAAEAKEAAEAACKAVEAELATARAEAEAARLAEEDDDDQDGEIAALDLDENRDAIAQLSSRLRRLRRTSRLVRGTAQMLREAAEKELSDPSLINQAMAAELENIKAMRAAEIAEMDVIVGALRPMLDINPAAEAEKEGER